jgi:2'-hydroxyisoflavone reductase
MLDAAAAVAGTSPEVIWVDDEWLVEQGVAPWSELPLWLPPSVAPYPWDQDTTAAERAGLRTRSITDSARDTLAWLRANGTDKTGKIGKTDAANPRTGKAGLDPDREKELLETWKARQG